MTSLKWKKMRAPEGAPTRERGEILPDGAASPLEEDVDRTPGQVTGPGDDHDDTHYDGPVQGVEAGVRRREASPLGQAGPRIP